MTIAALPDYLARQAERVTIAGAQPYFLDGTSGTAFLTLHGWAATAEAFPEFKLAFQAA